MKVYDELRDAVALPISLLFLVPSRFFSDKKQIQEVIVFGRQFKAERLRQVGNNPDASSQALSIKRLANCCHCRWIGNDSNLPSFGRACTMVVSIESLFHALVGGAT